MNKHIVIRVNALFLGALCPSKSGLMNKHIVKHIVKSGLMHKHPIQHREHIVPVFPLTYRYRETESSIKEIST